MKQLMRLVLTLFVISGSFTSVALHAEENENSNIAEFWVMVPKAGMESKFQEALKGHIEHRQEKEDPRMWNTYRPVLGDGLNKYYIRTCCVSWAKLDDYREWSNKNNMGQHFQEKVGQYVESYEHYFAEVDMDNGHWPDDSSKFVYFGVTDFHAKFGMYASVQQGKKMLSDHAKEMKWPYYWSWSRRIGGEGGLSLVIPYSNYAEMAPPKETFYEALSKHLGGEDKAREMFQNWDNNFESATYQIYALDKNLSMQAK
ncbi:hypothetical protein [Thalassotalea mangrovi]|uniref:Uncharacterized protein n=1 Tax=Thalassotalea mangrovi TaxID=2572245 RepID=A0A4U1B6U2_9GAMM|nr:hypothetical protein [Thalassotalea mangrovi]TKB46188.1 hypothetical protein E8M12_06065 [Thalassotalea mangrovi]